MILQSNAFKIIEFQNSTENMKEKELLVDHEH